MLRQIGHRSFKKTKCLYLYIQYPEETALISCFLTDVEHDTPPGTLHCYRLTPAESIALRHWDGPLVSLIDYADFHRLDGVPLSRLVFDVLQADCFVHIITNPVDFLTHYMKSGRSVKWTNAGIYYDNDLVRREQGLSVTLYKLDDVPFTFFHLSNPSLAGVIHSFEEEVLRDRARMRFYHILDEEQHEFSKQTIASFIDHPVFSYSLLHGEAIPALATT
jgi:hypothetical protein